MDSYQSKEIFEITSVAHVLSRELTAKLAESVQDSIDAGEYTSALEEAAYYVAVSGNPVPAGLVEQVEQLDRKYQMEWTAYALRVLLTPQGEEVEDLPTIE